MGLVDQYKTLELFALVDRLKSSRGLEGTGQLIKSVTKVEAQYHQVKNQRKIDMDE